MFKRLPKQLLDLCKGVVVVVGFDVKLENDR